MALSRFNPFTKSRDFLGGSSGASVPDTTAENDIIVGSSTIGTWVKKTIAEFKTILGLGSAAYTDATAYAPALGSDDNYVTDAEKTVIGNTSGINTGDQAEPATLVVAPSGGDYTSIQAAHDALPTGGGSIFVREGTYTETADITISKSNCLIVGTGKSTIIQSSTNAVNAAVFKITGDDNILRGFNVRGSRLTYVNARGIVVTGDRCYVEDNWIADVGKDGIKLEGSNYSNIINNHVGTLNDADKIGQDGIWLDQASTNCLVQGNTVMKAQCVGIETDAGCHHTKIADNLMVYCCENSGDVWGGIKILGNQGNVITGNVIQSSYQHGIFIMDVTAGGDDTVIVGNSIYSCAKHGVYLNGVNNCLVSSNRFWGSWGDANTYDAIFLDGDADSNLIVANQGVDTGKYRYGVNISAATCNSNKVFANNFTGNATADLNDAGTGTIIISGTNTGDQDLTGLIPKSLIDAAGDLIYGDAADSVARLGKGDDGQVLTLASGLPSWATPSAGGAPYLLTSVKVGNYQLPCGVNNFSPFNTSAALPAGDGTIHAIPFIVEENSSYDRISLYCNLCNSTHHAHLGIYSDNAGYPDQLILDAGAATISGTGLVEITIDQDLTPGVYWVSALHDTPGSGVRWYALQNVYALNPFGTVGLITPQVGRYKAQAYGNLPATFPASASTDGYLWAIGMRRSA